MPSFKCSKCGRQVDGIRYEINKRSYCYDCYQVALNEKESIDLQKKELYDYICSLFSINELPQEVIHSLNHLIVSGKKIKAMQFTLRYCYEIINQPCLSVFTVARVIENNYLAAKKYLEETNQIKEHNHNINLNIPSINIKVSPTTTRKKPHIRRATTKIEEL